MTKIKYPAVILLLFCSNLLLAQSAPAWGGGADQNDISFGFTFGYILSNYKIIKQPNWQAPFLDQKANKITDSLTSISSNKMPGFALGFITRYRLSEHLELRSTPSLIFADRSLNYTYTVPSEDVVKQVQTTTVDIPMLIKLKSDRIENFRAYVIGGLKYSFAIGKGNTDQNANTGLLDRQVKNVAGFASYEAGLGCDIYFEFFKLSPEIKLSNSLGNVLVPENQPFSGPISKLWLHTLQISLYFE